MRTLQTIISAQAILPSITTMITRELLTDSTMITQFTKYPENTILYAAFVGAAMYQTYRIDDRYKIFDTYENAKKSINMFLLVTMIVFFRNIENAI